MSIFEGDRAEKEAGPCPASRVLDKSLQGVEGAAQEGCHLCHLLSETLTKAERQDLEGCEKIAYGYWNVDSMVILHLIFLLPGARYTVDRVPDQVCPYAAREGSAVPSSVYYC